MTEPSTHTTPRERSSSGRMVATMGSIGLVASILLVATYNWTLPFIEANQAEYLEQSIREVMPEAVSRTDWRLVGGEVLPEDGSFTNEPRLFAGFRADGSLMGFAIEAQGQGYADVIRLIYGYSTDCACIIGMKVLESRETPGLGDKIDSDPAFQSNFDSLDVRWSAASNRIEAPLELIKKGTDRERWQIDGISGATISSRAVTDILNASNAVILPIIHANLDKLKASIDE